MRNAIAKTSAPIVLALITIGLLTAVPSHADEGPQFHQVRYTVTSDAPYSVDIYYRDTDPPTFVDYSHDPYVFSPKVHVDIGPNRPWELTAALADPIQWAMVVVSSGLSPNPPTFHCQLAIDGIVVNSASGPRGALCSLRRW